MENLSSSPGKGDFEGFIYLLGYISDNKNLEIKHYAKIEDAPLSDLLRQSSIKTDNQLMVFTDSIWQDLQNYSISTTAYIVFYQGGRIDDCTHVPGIVAQYSADSGYNAAYTAGMALEYLRMLNYDLLNKEIYLFPEQSPHIILDSNSVVRMSKNCRDTKHTRQISKIIHF